MFVIDEATPKIAIPDGYFVCLPTGQHDSYPGFGIFFSKDGKTAEWNNLIAMVEHDTANETIQTTCFKKNDNESYVATVRFEDGTIIQD